MSAAPTSKRSTIKRLPDRGTYESQQILDILDEGLVAHVGIVQDGLPIVIPMGYARWGDKLLLHGSLSSRLMKVRQHCQPCTVCVQSQQQSTNYLPRNISFNIYTATTLQQVESATVAWWQRSTLSACLARMLPQGKQMSDWPWCHAPHSLSDTPRWQLIHWCSHPPCHLSYKL